MTTRLSVRPGLLALVILLICFDTGHAFDGKRKGFNLGVGLSATPYSKWRNINTDEQDEFQTWGLNGLIGYAFSEQNLLTYQGSFVLKIGDPERDIDGMDQGFDGLFWTHFYGDIGRSIYSTAGIIRPLARINRADYNSGYGLAVGGGYEFAKQVQIGLIFALARSTDNNRDINHTMIHLTFTVVGY